MSEGNSNDEFDKYLNKKLIKNATSYWVGERRENGGRIAHSSVSETVAKLAKRGISIMENAFSHQVRHYKKDTKTKETIKICLLSTSSIVNTSCLYLP